MVLKKGVPSLHRNHIDFLKKKPLKMLQKWEASHTSENKEGGR